MKSPAECKSATCRQPHRICSAGVYGAAAWAFAQAPYNPPAGFCGSGRGGVGGRGALFSHQQQLTRQFQQQQPYNGGSSGSGGGPAPQLGGGGRYGGGGGGPSSQPGGRGGFGDRSGPPPQLSGGRGAFISIAAQQPQQALATNFGGEPPEISCQL